MTRAEGKYVSPSNRRKKKGSHVYWLDELGSSCLSTRNSNVDANVAYAQSGVRNSNDSARCLQVLIIRVCWRPHKSDSLKLRKDNRTHQADSTANA